MEELILQPKKTILIVCRSLNEVHFLSRFKPQSRCRYILASDDIRVQKAVKKYPWVNDVCWIEQMESFYNVAQDVIAFLDIINPWLESLGDDKNGIPKDLLFWIKHAEGGMTTQRIQDLLLLIRSYLNLIESINVTDIIILSHPGMQWEDDVLIETARSKNIDFKVIGSKRPGVLIGKVIAFFKVFAREPYYILNFLRAKLYSLFRLKKESHEKEIVFQLCSSANKHIAHTVPLMVTLKNKGYNPVALCWWAPGGAKKVRKMGLRAEELEKYGPLSSIWEGDYHILHTWRKALARKEKFLSHPELQYRLVPLGSLLWPSIQFFFTGELPQRYRLMRAIKRYYARHSPLAIRFWTDVLPEGVIPSKNLNECEGILTFQNFGFHVLSESPYQPKPFLTYELLLALGPAQKRNLENNGIPSNNIVTIGQVSWEDYSDLQKTFTQDQSRSHLKIPLNNFSYILYDSGTILRGYLAVQEQVETTTFLLDFAKEHTSIALVIKPHPNHKQGMLESLIDTYSLENVFIIDKKNSLFHCINATDFLITKWSTGGIEAMYLKKPVVSIILDGEKKFKIYADAAEYVNNIEELNELITQLMNDNNYRLQWTANLNDKATQFLNDNFYVPPQLSSSELGADAIINLIENRKESNGTI